MNQKQTSPQAVGLTLGDIYYVLFRRKWMILVFSTVGLLAALTAFLLHRPLYQSEAKLLIRYILDEPSPLNSLGNNAPKKSPDDRGETLINSEMQILTSLDVADQVAAAFGPEKILAKAGGGKNPTRAAALIRSGLQVDVPGRSSVIRLTFEHPDADIVRPVLGQIIDSYFKRTAEIHRDRGLLDESLTRETDDLRQRLVQTEQALKTAKARAGVTSLEDTKKLHTDQIAKIQQDLFNAEAELAERTAAVAELGKLIPDKTETNTPVAAVPAEKAGEYKKANALLDTLEKEEQALLLQYKPESQLVKEVREQIAGAEKLKRRLEEGNPGLIEIKNAEAKAGGNGVVSETQIAFEKARVVALQSKIKVLTGQLDKIRGEALVVDENENSITDLERKKDLLATQYSAFSRGQELMRIEEALGEQHASNISKIQAPSPPFLTVSKLYKVMAMVLFGCMAAGIGLAFLLELYLDHSLKRPGEVENRLGLPLFLSIPAMARNGKSRRLKIPGLRRRLPEHGEAKPAEPVSEIAMAAGNGAGLPANGDAAMRAFADALRDRLTLYFEVKNLTHKPKLVALTSCSPGAGVTTIAAGLAASLSEGGDGNVLLVDMTAEQGAAHHYYRGKLECGLDDALESEKRSGALMRDNLYVVSEGGNHDKLPRMLPKRFTNLVPKLKASDYDYIIFDMPPISQISITPKLARFMDMVLLVVESEKTDREMARRAGAILRESQANVGTVLNKARTYVPRRLQQEM
jgi:succinoglycan biosynthesis transport protein ExoP